MSGPLTLSVSDLDNRIEGFLSDYLEGKSAQTVGTYGRALNEFQRYHAVRAQRPSSRFPFSEAGVQAYKTYLMEERELSQVSVSTYLTALRRLCDYLVARGELEENPAKAVKGNRRPQTHSRGVLTEDQVETFLDTIETDTLIGLRDNAIARLMLYAGLAEIEIVRADREDLEQTLMGAFLRVQGKGHTTKDEQVPLDGVALSPLVRYLEARRTVRPSDPLVVSHGRRSNGKRLNTRSVRSRINGYLKEADLKKPGISPHSLTHTAALIWLNDGMPVEEVRRRMRHGTLDTTMIYFRKQGLLKPSAEREAKRAESQS